MVELPTSPAELSLLCRRLEVHCRKLADDADRQLFEQRPGSVREAVDEALSTLYFYPKPDPERGAGVLQKIIRILAPEVHRTIEEHGVNVAFRVVRADDDNEDYEGPVPDEPQAAPEPQPGPEQNLTAGEWDELARLVKEPQATYGKGRARIQNRLVRLGFARRHDTPDGERCEITHAGRARLEQGR